MNFISCSGDISLTNNGRYLRCDLNSGTAEVLTEQEISQLYSGALSEDQAWDFSTYIYVSALLAWGFKVISHKLRFGR